MKYAFHGAFAPYIYGLIEKKRSLGYDYYESERILRTFDEFCREQFPCETHLTAKIVMRLAEQTGTEQNLFRLNRVSVIRELARHMNSVGCQAYILPLDFTKKTGRHIPYIFSYEELARLFREIDSCAPSLNAPTRHLVVSVIFRMIYCCGLRPVEARRLRREDVSLRDGVVKILESKGHKDRIVVLSESMLALCVTYDQRADTIYHNSGEHIRIERARAAYELIYQLNHHLIEDPTGLGPKTIPQTRTGRALADPMIYLNVSAVMRRCDPEKRALYDARAQQCVEEILRYHVKPELKCTLETVGPEGELQTDTTAGRVVNPGHDIECSWFLMEQAQITQDDTLFAQAVQIFDYAIHAGWDKEYGGLLYFIDCLGCPPEAYEHDMKLWWPHNEILIASLMIYQKTGKQEYWDWFCKTADYCREHFCEPEFGEWYGYLRRDGLPTQPPCKGSTFKGPFHVPRSLMIADRLLTQLEQRQ